MALEDRDVLGGPLTPVVNVTPTGSLPPSVSESWRAALVEDESLNSSNKSFVTPAGTERQILWIWVEFTSTATVGNRQLCVRFADQLGDIIGSVRAGIVQAASLTRNYMFAPALADLTAFRDTSYLMTPLPAIMILPPGFIVQVYDSAAIDAGADDIDVKMLIASRAI
jgi:hypothetical protein